MRAAIFAGTLWLIAPVFARAAALLPNIGPMSADPGAPPSTEMGGGSYFFAQDLGTMLRVAYDTESYGQDMETGDLDIGTMQMYNFDDSAVFFDGQVTVNDPNGVGFNVGVGYRWMSFQPHASAAGVMQGISIWADGTSTAADNFFPQIGLSYESLGEMWDLRANGYIPVGQDTQIGDFLPSGEVGFEGNSISQLTQATIDTSFYAGEVEFARRLLRDRDAWAFAGPYFLSNDADDTVGYRAGFRGYAYPDLLLQIAVSNDDIFETNAAFTLIWFVGRTRTHFQPACGVPDRFREPVMRNDYVVLAQSSAGGGVPITDAEGDDLRIVHVDSTAAPGGDGTFENPFDMITDVNGAGSLEGDVIFVHSNSVFTGQSVTLKNDQRFLGEGLDAAGEPFIHTIVTSDQGTIEIPESEMGARGLPRPMINDAVGDAITLANNNEVANFDIDGGDSAIAGMNITENTNLHDLSITDTLMDAIELNTVSEDVRLVNIDVTGGSGFGISLTNFETTAAVTLDEYTYDGLAGTAGGLELDAFDGTLLATDSSFTNGTGPGVSIIGASDGGITFQDTVTFMSVDGNTFDINGFTGTLTVNSDITNDTARSVSIQGVSDAGATVTFTGEITDTGTGILVSNNTDGTILFTGDLDLDTDTDAAITVTGNNNNADINFAGQVDITTTSGAGFTATGPGTLTVSDTTNSIRSTTGTLVDIQGMAISNAGVNFSELNRTGAGTSSAVVLMNNTGGPITLGTVGDDAGESGSIAAGTGDAIVINNSANVTVSGLTIANSAGSAGVHVEKTNAVASTVNLNDLAINGGTFGVQTIGGGTGALTMTVNDTAINGSTDAGMLFSNVDVGTVQVNNADLNGTNASATADGVRIVGSNASITFNDQSSIQNFSENDFEVDGGAGTISYAGDITNTDASGNSVHVHNVTGGTITFTATNAINDENDGIVIGGALAEANTGGTINFLGDYDLNTGASDAVTITNNTGATISLSNLNIDTTTGDGFVATGGGTLTVLGTTNTIDTGAAVGLTIDDMTIGAAGVSFQTVNVNGGANAIVLSDLNGTGQVAIGNAAGAANSGGMLTTIGDAIILDDAANVDLRHIQIVSAGGQGINITHSAGATTAMDVTIDDLNLDLSTGTGISVVTANTNTFGLRLTNGDLEENVDMSHTGSGAFRVLVDSTDIMTTGGTDAMSITFGGSVADADVTIQNSSNFIADTGRALDIAINGAGASVEIELDASTFMSASAEDLNLVNNVGATTNLNVTNNTFSNSTAANDVLITSDGAAGAGTRIDLNLVNNGLGASTVVLETLNNGGGFNFGVVDRDNANANNPANVTFSPLITDFEDITGPVESPALP